MFQVNVGGGLYLGLVGSIILGLGHLMKIRTTRAQL